MFGDSGLREFRFSGVDGKRQTYYVDRMPKKACEAIAAKLELLVAMTIAKATPDPEAIRRAAGLKDKQYNRLVAWGLAPDRVSTNKAKSADAKATQSVIDALNQTEADTKAKSLELATWIDTYIESRPELKDSTLEQIVIAGDNLVARFGKTRSIATTRHHQRIGGRSLLSLASVACGFQANLLPCGGMTSISQAVEWLSTHQKPNTTKMAGSGLCRSFPIYFGSFRKLGKRRKKRPSLSLLTRCFDG